MVTVKSSLTCRARSNCTVRRVLPERAVFFKPILTMAADQGEFDQLLNTLLSPDNDVRSQAEVRICKIEAMLRT